MRDYFDFKKLKLVSVLTYTAGYKRSHNTGYDSYTPYCPYQPYKSYSDPQSDFEHGYAIGYEKGFGS